MHTDVRRESDGAVRRTPQIEDWIFESLDHQRVDDGGDSWVISVVGVHVDGNSIWVQVVKEPEGETIIVQMERETNPADVLASLKHAGSADSRFVVVRAPGTSH